MKSRSIRVLQTGCLFCLIAVAITVAAQSIPAWQPNTAYAVGALVTFNGQEFKCIQAHTSQVGWEPPNVPALWGLVSGSTPDFSVGGTPGSQTVTAGGSTSFSVSIASLNGFSNAVSLSVSGLPSGATGSFSPTSVSGGSGSSTLSISTSSSTPTGTFTITLTASGGTVSHTANVTFNVNATANADFSISVTPGSQAVTAGGGSSYTLSLAAQGGFNSAVALSVSGLPNGATASFSPTSVSGGSGSSTLTVSSASSTPTGNFTLSVTGASGSLSHSVGLTFTVNASGGIPSWQPNISYAVGALVTFNGQEFKCIQAHTSQVGWEPPNVPALWQLVAGSADFSLSVASSSQTVTAGNGASYSVSAPALNGFTGTVSLSVSGLPSGATASFSPTSITGSGASTLAISTSTSASQGSFTVNITGSSGGLTHSASVTLTIQAPANPDFSLAVTPNSQTVGVGAGASYSVQVSPQGGFSGGVSLSVSGLPSGATATFSPSSVSGGSGSSTLTVSTSSSTPTGSSTLTISGGAGALNHTITVTLTVSSAPPSGLPKHLLLGYWQDFNNGAKCLRLADVPTSFAIIATAFANSTSTAGAVDYTTDSGLSACLPGGYTDAQFISDIATVHGRGQKVILSVGGANGNIVVNDAASATNFANSLHALMTKFGFDGVDIDLENGVDVTNLTNALRQLSSLSPGLIITMAPQTTDVQKTTSDYFAVALNIKDILTMINTQYYNSGSMFGCDGNIYQPGTEDFVTAQACVLLQGGLRPDQVGLGLPAQASAASSGLLDPSVVVSALHCLTQGTSCGSFKPTTTWPTLRGVMTWNTSWDAANNSNFSNTVKPALDGLP